LISLTTFNIFLKLKHGDERCSLRLTIVYMRIIDLSRYEHRVEVLLLSMQIGLTFYDTSYISIAKNLNCNLVTDDDELIRISEKLGVKTIKSMDLPVKS